MNTTIKTGWLVVLFLWVLTILPSTAQSGLIHHHVMVSNSTMHKISVSVVAANDKTYTKEIMPYAFDTFDVGAHCPSYLKGRIFLPTGTLDIVLHCIGTSSEGSADFCFFTCSSSSWDIVKRATAPIILESSSRLCMSCVETQGGRKNFARIEMA